MSQKSQFLKIFQNEKISQNLDFFGESSIIQHLFLMNFSTIKRLIFSDKIINTNIYNFTLQFNINLLITRNQNHLIFAMCLSY